MSELTVEQRLDNLEKLINKHGIHLASDNGQSRFDVLACDDSIGMWLEDKANGVIISLYSNLCNNCIGMFGKARHNGINIGFGCNRDGNPYVQLIDKDGKFCQYGAEQLMAAYRQNVNEDSLFIPNVGTSSWCGEITIGLSGSFINYVDFNVGGQGTIDGDGVAGF